MNTLFETYFKIISEAKFKNSKWKFDKIINNVEIYENIVHLQERLTERYQKDLYEWLFLKTIKRQIIDYINRYKTINEIDFLKVRFTVAIDKADKVIISNYFRTNPTTSVEFLDMEKETMKRLEQETQIQNEYDFIFNDKYSDEEKFCMYVNKKEGYELITVDKLRQILED